MLHSLHRLVLAFTVLAGVLATMSHAQTPAHFWSQRFGAASNDEGYAVAVDASGNVYVTGSFLQTVNFGGLDLVSAGSFDIFIAKYSATGTHLWSQRFGSTGSDVGYDIAVDASGNVILTGIFAATVNFGGVNLVSAGATDVFVAKYNSAGSHQWSARGGGTSSDFGWAVATDASGNVAATGYFNATANFGGANLVSAGTSDIFVVKYTSGGAHVFSQRYGNTSPDEGRGIGFDTSGNVVVTGYFWLTVDFGGGNLVPVGAGDIFLAKYDPAGAHVWSKRIGGISVDSGNSLAMDGNNVIVTGEFYASVDFGGGSLPSAGDRDMFLARYDAAGAHVWSLRGGGTVMDIGYGVALDSDGNATVIGDFNSPDADFGGGSMATAGNADVFLASYDVSGAHRWSQRFGGTSLDAGAEVATDASGDIFATGAFVGNVNFGGVDLVNGGARDVFLAKYAKHAAEPLIGSIVDVGNDQGRVVRIQFTSSGYDHQSAAGRVQRYDAFRRVDTLPVAASTVGSPSFPPGNWEFAATTQAYAEDEYFLIAPTLADSTIDEGQHHSVFFIRAGTDDSWIHYDSAIDSGYSIDNLAPSAPSSFAYAAGNLTWDESSAADFDYFTVYGGNGNRFANATLVGYTVDPAMDVSGSPYVYYFVTATDFSGNEGIPAAINTLSGTGGPPKSYVLSVSAYPNPFNPATTIRYTVPSTGRVIVSIHDARGAHVVTLLDERKAAGSYAWDWNGTNRAGGVLSSGVYFARISHASGTKSYKLVLLK